MVKKPRVPLWLKRVNIVEPSCMALAMYQRRKDSGQTVNYHGHDNHFTLTKKEVYDIPSLINWYESWYAKFPDEAVFILLLRPRFCPEDYHYVNKSGKHGIQMIRWEEYLKQRGIDATPYFKFKFVKS